MVRWPDRLQNRVIEFKQGNDCVRHSTASSSSRLCTIVVAYLHHIVTQQSRYKLYESGQLMKASEQCSCVLRRHVVSYKETTASGGPRQEFAPRCRLVSPTLKQTGQESGCEIVRNFQILIVSEVKICKQCLQTASASGDEDLGFASGPHSGTFVPRSPDPKTNIPCAATED